MSYTKRLILILSMLMLTAAMTFSQAPVELGGSTGLSLLNSLTKSSLNQTNDTINATNNTTDLNGTKGIHSAKFLSWGTGPKNHSVSYNYSRGIANSSVVNSPPDPLAMTSGLKDLNDLAEKNAFATA